ATINNNHLISYNSSALITNFRYNSNAIITHDKRIRYNSQAIITHDKEINNNSNSIVTHNRQISYISSATINNNRAISWNSSAILNLDASTLEQRIINNSNAIILLDNKINININDITANSNAIIMNTQNIYFNSNAIVTTMTTSGLQVQIDENKLGIRYNSNAILSLTNGQQDTVLTQAPITSDITLRDSVFIHPTQRIYVADNATIDGSGAVIIFGDPAHSQFVVKAGKTVTLKNVQLLRVSQDTLDLRYNLYVDSSSPSNWRLEDGILRIGQNVILGLSENVTMTQGLIELVNDDNAQAQTFKLVGIEGQKQFQISPSNAYCNALSRADNGLTWAQRVAGYTSYTPSQLPTRFTNNGTTPILIKCNDNTFGIQNINLSGFEHISKTTSINYTGAIGLLGTAAVDIGDQTFSEFEKNKNVQEKYDMVFVVQNINNQLRLLKDDLLFTGQLQFADFGENVLDIDTVLTERIKPKVGSTDPDRTIPQVNFATDFLQLTSLYGMARLIFDDSRIRINNQFNAFIAYENSYLGGNTIEVTGDPIWDLYDPAFGGKEFVLDVDELIGLDDIDNKPIVSDFYSIFKNNKKKLRTALDLIYEQELKKF
ncbi:MAG: hypothetical protein SZ59_C0005G0001, partial [candidate division TM6 bacterium GW2011_GWF2_28_16]